MKNLFVILFCFVFIVLKAQKSETNTLNMDPKMAWFQDAKLGIFIHYGIYAVNGIGESWSFKNNQISYPDYMKQLNGFTAKNYHPEAWAKLFKEAGAKYAVLTAKHHDGVALWDTKLSDLSVVKKSPAKRDLITPYAQAMRNEGLKVGIYFSHLDWSDPNYATVFSTDGRSLSDTSRFDFPISAKEDTAKWNLFVTFRNEQLRELSKIANPDLWWFDGSWTRSGQQWKMKELRDLLLSWNPNSILNARMKGYGDYETPEQGLPIFGPKGVWELCMTINDSWGYQQGDTNYKTINYIIRVFAECISLGGNLLLDVGPKEDGTIANEQVQVLKGLGRWTTKHAEAIYATERGLPFGHFYGPTTLSKDHKTIYLFVMDTPKDDIVIKGIRNNVMQIRVVGSNDLLTSKRNGGAPWLNIPGVLMIDLPAKQLDQNVTVIAIELKTSLELYRGEGGAIESN